MRLLIYFYIVWGLFKLFSGLTHGMQSNSASQPGRGKPKSNKLPGGSHINGKGWTSHMVSGFIGGDCNIAGQTCTVCFTHFCVKQTHLHICVKQTHFCVKQTHSMREPKWIVFSHDAVMGFGDTWINEFLSSLDTTF